MKIDFAPLIELGKRARKCKSEIERLREGETRIYQLSRMLPENEGLELINLYEQSMKDTMKIQSVLQGE